MNIGTGSKWIYGNPLPSGVQVAMSMGSSPNLAQPHEITEFLIPFSTFPGMQSIIGFRATAAHGDGAAYTAVAWPEGSVDPAPATWGELTISSTSVPEFGYVWLVAVASLAAVGILWRKRREAGKLA